MEPSDSTAEIGDGSDVVQTETKFDCDRCGKSFGLKHNLTRHIRTEHLSDPGFACERCGRKFTAVTTLPDMSKAVGKRLRSARLKLRPATSASSVNECLHGPTT